MILTTSMDAIELPMPSPRGSVRHFRADWERLEETTDRRVNGVLRRSLPGCWYLNPQCTVHCPRLTRAFFQRARKAQAAWCRTMTQSLGAANRQRAFRFITDDKRRRLEFTGILIIDGDELSPWEWYQREAQLGMHPESDLVTLRRPIDLDCYRQPDSREHLKQLVRTELEHHLHYSPTDPLYVTPAITVAGIRPDRAFFAEAHKQCGGWHRRLKRYLSRRYFCQLVGESNLPTRMLLYHGTLVIDGHFYKPHRWPSHEGKKGKRRRDQLDDPTIAPADLGIHVPSSIRTELPT